MTTFPQYLDSFEELYRLNLRFAASATADGFMNTAERHTAEAAYWLALWQGEQRMAKLERAAVDQLQRDINVARCDLQSSGRRPVRGGRGYRLESDTYRSHLYDAINATVYGDGVKGFVLYRGFGNVA